MLFRSLLPSAQTGAYSRHGLAPRLPVDKGLRPIDVVTHKNFTTTARTKATKAAEDPNRLRPLDKGQFLVLQLSVDNTHSYTWNFVVAQLIEDVSDIDTTDPESMLEFQIYRPTTLNKLDSKFVKWIGDTNKQWKGNFSRGLVKAIVELHVQVQGERLTAKSQQLIRESFL